MLDQDTQIMGPEELAQAQRRSVYRDHAPLTPPGYEPERLLGRGSFGEVWVALDRNTGYRVAIKFYANRGNLDWGLLSREVEKLRFLNSSRHVVQLLEVGWEANPPYYVMEYLEKGSLEERLKNGSPFDVDDAVALFREICVGLVHAHEKGILHCDLKPANVLLDRDGRPRLADFGQARLTGEQTPTLGTLFYMAPEQSDLKATPDSRWDVFAAGVILYRMLTGELPHYSKKALERIQQAAGLEARLCEYQRILREAPRAISDHRLKRIDRHLREILDRCLSIDPERRFPNVHSVLLALNLRALHRTRRPFILLGVLAPALFLAVVGLLAHHGLHAALDAAEADVLERALQQQRMATWSLANTAALRMDWRWRVLEVVASDDFLADDLEKTRSWKASNSTQWLGSEVQQRLQSALARHRERFLSAGKDSGWILTNDQGVQVAHVPARPELVGGDFSHRDYYRALVDPVTKKKLRDVHMSRIYRGRTAQGDWTGDWQITFSVPVCTDRDPDHVVGVLGSHVSLTHLVLLGGIQERWLSMVDTRPTDPNPATGERQEGVVFFHRELPRYLANNPESLPQVDANTLSVFRKLVDEAIPPNPNDFRLISFPDVYHQKEYFDPIHPRKDWQMCAYPVLIMGRPKEEGRTGMVAVAQEEGQVVLDEVRTLHDKVGRYGLYGLAAIFLVVIGLWILLLYMLNRLSRNRILGFLRRQVGGPDALTGNIATETPPNLQDGTKRT